MKIGFVSELFNSLLGKSNYKSLSYPVKFCRIMYLSIKNFIADEHKQRAITLTYNTIFAIVPIAALLFGIAKGFELQKPLKDFVLQKLGGVNDIANPIIEYADTTLKQAKGGIVAGAGILFLVWTVICLAMNIENSFNKIWHLPNRKDIFRKLSEYFSMMVFIPLLLIIVGSTGVFVHNYVDKIVSWIPWIGDDMSIIFSFFIELIPMLLIVVVLGTVYYILPNTKVRLRGAILGGIIAGILFQILQSAFIILQTSITSYNSIYGSFAAVPLFFIWLHWSWLIALFGAEISFVTHNIESGIFDNRSDVELCHKYRREYQVAMVKLSLSHYKSGKGAIPIQLISEKLSLWKIQTAEYIEELFQAGILIKHVDENEVECCVPGRPAEQLKILDVISTLDEYGAHTLSEDAENKLEAIDTHFKNINKVIEDSKENIRLD